MPIIYDLQDYIIFGIHVKVDFNTSFNHNEYIEVVIRVKESKSGIFYTYAVSLLVRILQLSSTRIKEISVIQNILHLFIYSPSAQK